MKIMENVRSNFRVQFTVICISFLLTVISTCKEKKEKEKKKRSCIAASTHKGPRKHSIAMSPKKYFPFLKLKMQDTIPVTD